jgi:hypothetical protein
MKPETENFSDDSTSPPTSGMPGGNDIEIQLLGLQRSGNHAVLAWMFQQFDAPVLFFNNVDHFSDPFLGFHHARLPNMIEVRRGATPENLRHLEELRRMKKHALIYSYENLKLSRLKNRGLIEDRPRLLGHSAIMRRGLLLRDFFNWIASRARLFEEKGQPQMTKESAGAHIALWIMYAKEFVGETEFARDVELVPISYNRWIADDQYRAYLLGRLAVPFKDNSNTHVPDVGGGSSFDGGKFSGRPEGMQVGERWRYLLRPEFSDVLDVIRSRREEIEHYNQLIFGLSCPV